MSMQMESFEADEVVQEEDTVKSMNWVSRCQSRLQAQPFRDSSHISSLGYSLFSLAMSAYRTATNPATAMPNPALSILFAIAAED